MISDKQVTSKQKYKNLKRKLKLLLYEQECFLDELRKSERKMIKVQRDKNFLLDRLLQYERVEDSSGDSDSTMSSNESDSEIPALSQQNSRTASAVKQDRGSPAAATGGFGGHFPFVGGQPPSMDLSPSSSMLSNSMPGGMFSMLHTQNQLPPNVSLNGPTGQRLVAGSPAVTRGRGRPRAGGQGGVTRGGGGGRGTRGRGGGAVPAGLPSSSSGPGSSSSGGPGLTASTSGLSQQTQGTPSRGNSSNGNYATSSNQPPQLNPVPLGSPNQQGSGVMQVGAGDMSQSVQFAMYPPDNSGAAFMQQPQPQSQRYTPQPPPLPQMAGPQMSQQPQQQAPAGSLTPTGQQQQAQQQNLMQYSQQSTPQQQQPNVVLMGPPQSQQQQFMQQPPIGLSTDILLEGVMTHEDVERCLESSAGPDRYLLERISGDLPADIFSENSEDDGISGMGNSVSSEA